MNKIMKTLSLMFAVSAMLFSSGLHHEDVEVAKAAESWNLVTDASTLSIGDSVIIAAKNYNYALSTNQKNNNRDQASITKTDSTAVIVDDTQILTLEKGSKDNTYAFNTGSGYLYAASSSSNHLKTEGKLSDNSSWTINIATSGVATIKAQGSNTRNLLKYNSSSKLFSCYASGQQDICLYKLDDSATSATLESLTYTGTLSKTEYTTDDTFSPAGLTIKANYSDNTSKDVTNEVVWEDLTAGMTSIKGTYENKEITISGISVTAAAVKYTASIIKDVENIYVDETGSLSYEIKDQNGNDFSGEITSVTWTSSNEDILVIDNNGDYLAGSTEGEVTISLQIETSDANVKFDASLTLNVSIKSIVDVITSDKLPATGTSYKSFENIRITTGVLYSGNSASTNNTIQLRTDNNNSGIVSVLAKAIISKIEVEWNDNTASARKLDIYGSNVKYSSAEDLYNSDTQGTKIGSIDYSTSISTLPFNEDYAYIGIRSNNRALYLNSIKIYYKSSVSADNFIKDWAEMRVNGSNGICDYLNGKQSSTELDALLSTYNQDSFSEAEKAIINDASDGENNTIGNSIAYINAYRLKNSNSSQSISNILNLSNRSNISIILIVGLLGLTAVASYYFINKKKYSC